MFVYIFLALLGLCLLFWPDFARHLMITVHPLKPPRLVFVRLAGLTYLLVLAWLIWVERAHR